MRRTVGTNRTMTSADDIVADSEGEEDVVPGTLDLRDAERMNVTESRVAGVSKSSRRSENAQLWSHLCSSTI